MQSVQAGRVTYARAMGPMQFLPGTWARYASDGNGDGKADIQNLYDASLGAARYLCSGNLNLRDRSQVLSSILRYNNSMAYAQNVLGWAAAYATGVVPVDLPPIAGGPHRSATRTSPPAPRASGPGCRYGLPADDPLAPSLTLGAEWPAISWPSRPAPGAGVPSAPPAPPQNCQVFCLTPQAPTAPLQNCQVFCLRRPAGRAGTAAADAARTAVARHRSSHRLRRRRRRSAVRPMARRLPRPAPRRARCPVQRN